MRETADSISRSIDWAGRFTSQTRRRLLTVCNGRNVVRQTRDRSTSPHPLQTTNDGRQFVARSVTGIG